ncbi:thioredoin superfamily domain-containing protein [Histoplasma capsulatum]|uniref:Thioredoin superfamily domain-containing protein n=1 Tax=Ajellomyces capsulatus TaxID=5037 RepID=A0A8A1MGL5_AJECA|nr:thioredoin superfamily domain-containing protein [Histoplasma capsulatum]
MADSYTKSYVNDSDPLYLYTSLTAGSSHIITATSRLETILKANNILFRAVDVATDEEARRLWGRRSRGKKLPGLVRDGMIVGDLEEIEEWNEYGELKMRLGSESSMSTSRPTALSKSDITHPSITAVPTSLPVEPTPSNQFQIQEFPSRVLLLEDPLTLALRQAGEETASKAKENTRTKLVANSASANTQGTVSAVLEKTNPETSEPDEKRNSEPLGSLKGVPERIEEIGESISAHRPSLSGVATTSSADLEANFAKGMSPPKHDRGTVVSVTSPRMKAQLGSQMPPLQVNTSR